MVFQEYYSVSSWMKKKRESLQQQNKTKTPKQDKNKAKK